MTLLQRPRVASQLCEPAVFYNKHIATHKHLSKKKKKIYGIMRKYENDAFCIFPLGKSSKRESLANLDNKP